jgi:uncharacterized membrane protein
MHNNEKSQPIFIKDVIMFAQLSLVQFFITLILFASIDSLWLFTTSAIYKKHLTHLLSADINWIGVLLFYPLYALGLYVFVIKQFKPDQSLINLFLHGALFGIIAYGTYDLTNYATLKDWPAFLVVVDVLWGAFISGLVSVGTVSILKWLS